MLDAFRARFPHLGVALYAYDPSGSVTFEVIAPDGQTFTFAGPTTDDAVRQAWPAEAAPEPDIAPIVEPEALGVFD